MKITTVYQGNMRFADQGSAHAVMDAPKAGGGLGEAPTPKQMVLHGLAGCTGMDVLSILNKRKVEYKDLFVDVEAEQTAHHPRVFRAIRITYRITANPDDRPKIKRAIELSRNNFCGVSVMLEKTATIESVLELTPLSE
jgi:putative redox protein